MSTSGSPSHSSETHKEPRQAHNCEGLNTLLQAALASSSSTSDSHPGCEPCEPANEHKEGSRTRESSAASASASSPGLKDKYAGPRPPRPTYTQEQEDAIRFHRDDLSMTWTQVEEAYNGLCYADGTPWERRTISGLQSRYYRLLPVPVNTTKKQAKPRPELGILIMAPERRYWWMSTSEMTPEERRDSSNYDPQDEYVNVSEDGDDEDDDPKSQDSRKL